METTNDFILYCHFCGIGKKTIRASTFEEAKQILEDNEHIEFDEIIRLTKPCWVDESLSRIPDKTGERDHDEIEYKNWGSE